MNGGRDDDLIRQIESRIDIVDIIGERVELSRRGNRYWGLCPFHSEKTPSFSVSQEKQLFYCFGCHQGGNVFTFLKKHDNLEFREALQYLANRAGIDISRYQSARTSAKSARDNIIIEINQEAARFYHELLRSDSGRTAREYLRRRHVDPETMEKFYLGYAPDDWRQLEEYLLKRGFPIEAITESGLVRRSQRADLYIDFLRNRIIFPIHDLSGRIIGFGGRLICGDGPKYLNSAENRVFSKRFHLFGLYHGREAIRSASEVILVEGYMDCLALHQCGVANAVATLGTAFTREQAKLIKRYTETVLVMYDGDEAGQRETLRALDVLRQEGIHAQVIPLPPGVDPDILVREKGKEEFLNFVQNNRVTVTEYKLQNYLKSGLAASWERKVEILWSLFPEVDRVKSVLAQERQLNVLAHRLNLPEGDVKREFNSWKRNHGTVGSIRNRNRVFRNNRKREEKRESRHFEERLLVRMIADHDLYLRIKGELGIDTFSDPSLRNLALTFDSVCSTGEPGEARYRFREEIVNDDAMSAIWARICMLEEENPLTAYEIEHYIRRQTVLRERTQWQEFGAQLAEIELNGDFFSVLRSIVRLGDMTFGRAGKEGSHENGEET
ncbi:MAG: DNA primase [Syntrophomonadaceae bacterium]|nr:DNA primase [Syntrophomonadaceae bacterium]